MDGRRPGRRRGRGLAAVSMVALALAGCASEVTIEGTPAEAVARAAEQTDGTVRFRVHATMTLDPFVATQVAEGIVEPDGDSHTTITTTVEGVGGPDREGGDGAPAGALGALGGTNEVISVGGVVYTRFAGEDGPSRRRPLPAGVEWVAAVPGATGAVSVDVSGYLQARAILDVLGDVTEVVEDRGTTEVDGEPVRWLRAVAPGADGAERLVPPGTTIDVAVDADGRVRRVAFELREDGGPHTRVIADYHDHDVDETVEPPPADATIRQDELEGSGPAP